MGFYGQATVVRVLGYMRIYTLMLCAALPSQFSLKYHGRSPDQLLPIGTAVLTISSVGNLWGLIACSLAQRQD